MTKKVALWLLIGCLAFLGVGCTPTPVVETPAPDAELVTAEPEFPMEDVPTELPAPESVGEFIGLAVAAPLGAGADVYFDNLVVYAP